MTKQFIFKGTVIYLKCVQILKVASVLNLTLTKIHVFRGYKMS